MPDRSAQTADIVVAGSGPSALTAALVLAELNRRVVVVGPLARRQHAAADGSQTRDTRTSALFEPSLRLLDNLGVWSSDTPGAAPLKRLRLIDDTDRLVRAPELDFEATEIGYDAFGLNVPNADLVDRLAQRMAEQPLIRWLDDTVATVRTTHDHAIVETAQHGSVIAQLVVAADGRTSCVRQASGISAKVHNCPQTAIATRFGHERPHHFTSTEFHRRAGPLTTVPLPGHASSLVWVETPERVRALLSLTSAEFADELSQHLGRLLGTVSDVGPRVGFPLQSMTVTRYSVGRTVLIGEAAHVIPPIGAQGLNLGLRDIGVLADVLLDNSGDRDDCGNADLIATYDRRRRADVGGRTAMVDLLNRSLYTDQLPITAMRSATMLAMAGVGPLRRQLMKVGMGLQGTPPRVMRSKADFLKCQGTASKTSRSMSATDALGDAPLTGS